jgi:hypothetical protein
MNRISRVTTGGLAMAAILLLSLASGSVLMHAGESSMKTKPNANEVGIWKAYSPRGMKGELNNYDPIGLIAGALIHADCSLTPQTLVGAPHISARVLHPSGLFCQRRSLAV